MWPDLNPVEKNMEVKKKITLPVESPLEYLKATEKARAILIHSLPWDEWEEAEPLAQEDVVEELADRYWETQE